MLDLRFSKISSFLNYRKPTLKSIVFQLSLFFVTFFVTLFVYQIVIVLRIFQVPEKAIIEEKWWGKGNPMDEDKNIYPFKINVTQNILDDLRYRLERTRPITKPLEDTQWYGFNGDLAEEIRHYWRYNYKWKERENYLNKHPQFITSVQGLKIHFLHVKPQNSTNVKILPLLMLHGWPGSVREFYEIIPKLTTGRKDKKFVFEVVAPHLPGFIFSEASSKPGLGPLEVALIFKNLMLRLGFEKFYVQGGDLGAGVLHLMSTHFEENVLGFHDNTCVNIKPFSLVKVALGTMFPWWIIRRDHEKRIYPFSDFICFTLMELGYLHLHATKPDSLGIAIDDSPMGLAAYNLEKYSTGGHFDFRARKDGGLKLKFKYDDLLDIVTLYWVTKSSTTSFRFYAELFNKRIFTLLFWLPINIPTACARFSTDIYTPDGIIRDLFHNLVQLSDYDGGHFPALEKPGLLADDIFSAVAKMEKIHGYN